MPAFFVAFLTNLLVAAALAFISILFLPKPRVSEFDEGDPQKNDFRPDAKEGAFAPVLFGTGPVQLQTVAVMDKSVQRIIFAKSGRTVHYKFFMGLHAVIGEKPIDRLLTTYADNRLFDKTKIEDNENRQWIKGQFFQWDGLFADGLEGTMRAHLTGNRFDGYLQAEYPVGNSDLVPRFDEVAHLTFKGGAYFNNQKGFMWGNQPKPREMVFIAERFSTNCPYPSFANLDYTDVFGRTVSDFNPICTYWELVIKNDAASYGTTWETAAERVFNENLGWYYYLGGQTLADFEQEVEKYTRSVIYTDRQTGLREIEPLRRVTPSTLPEITTKDLIEDPELTQPDRAAMVNTLDVTFLDHRQKFKESAFTIYDSAHVATYGVRRDTLDARRLTRRFRAKIFAKQTLMGLTFAGLSGKISVSGLRPDLHEGSRFLLNMPEWNITDMVCVILRIVERGPRQNAVMIDFSQDIFDEDVEAIVVEDGEPDVGETALAANNQTAIEQPYFAFRFSEDPIDSNLSADPGYGKIAAFAEAPNSDHFGYDVQINSGAGYNFDKADEFSPYGSLTSDIAKADTTIGVSGASEFTAGTIIYVTGEFMLISSVGTSTLTVKRGILDTAPAAHSSGDGVFNLFADAGTNTAFTAGDDVDVKLLPFTGLETLDIADATALNVAMNSRAIRPLPVGQLKANGSFDDFEDASGSVSLTWAARNRLQQTDLSDVVAHRDASTETAEAGTTYRVKASAFDSSGTLISVFFDANTGSGLSATVDLSSLPSGTHSVTLEVTSVRDGYESWTSPNISVFVVPGGTTPSGIENFDDTSSTNDAYDDNGTLNENFNDGA